MVNRNVNSCVHYYKYQGLWSSIYKLYLYKIFILFDIPSSREFQKENILDWKIKNPNRFFHHGSKFAFTFFRFLIF